MISPDRAEVETVIEELAEEGEPGIERRRQALVRRGIGDDNIDAFEFDAACFGHGKPIRSDAAARFRKKWRPARAAQTV